MNQLGALLFLTALVLFSTFLNWYSFQAVRTLLEVYAAPRTRQFGAVIYWILFSGVTVWILLAFLRIFSEGEITASTQSMLNVFLTVVVTQVTLSVFLLGEDLYRQASAGIGLLQGQAFSLPERRSWLSILALTVAAVPFFSFVYGIVVGKYNYKVHREVLYVDALPEAFEGFTITQLSDIHAGSLRNQQAVAKGVALAQRQQSDLIVFTGDLVNHKADEIDPLLPIFETLEAPYGKFAVLGNHDYGDYVQWPSPADKAANLAALKQKFADMGFRLLLDEHVPISRGEEAWYLLGVENWGVGFKAKGDLEAALQGVPESAFKVLLSHDPSHWTEIVKSHPIPIQLTLSGHTHGMQFGIETPIVRWSPVQYRYPNWAGLAEEAGRYLYVNRGFGFHAFSGRVGIWPEITVIELRRRVS
ncbi:metallophosphoesterase [Nitritalea halalkaliphila LW7]|uniref:Metallophosphoesterase n=1 Tax=Nitritalea halalkaliphila LW7 TaxID=1189621 RepID=I5C4Z4_9BACT|nr:metallophosphoesterase [Nitritalea halalkaliphila LW7]